MNHACLLQFFKCSSFTYLAIEVGGESIELKQIGPARDIVASSPGVGFVALPIDTGRLPRVGELVRRGHVLMRLKRFKSYVEVVAPCDGEIARVDVVLGQFYEFGVPIVHLRESIGP
jgi:hypothetical protein